MDLDNYKEHSHLILRIGLSLVLFWFGINQLINPEPWTGLIPGFLSGFSGVTLIIINGIFELILGSLLLVGLFTRVVAFIFALHLITIIIQLGYGPVAVRDVGLLFGAIAVFLRGPDRFTLDNKRKQA